MANIKDVARLAGVSISTVSRVINNSATVVQHKREAVLRAMSDLQYKPNRFAKALVSNKSDTLGLVVGDLADPFFGLLMQGIERVANSYNKQLLISSGHHNKAQEIRAINSLIDRRCDGLIVHSKALDDAELLQLLQPLPASVLINRKLPEMTERSIYLNNLAAGKEAVNHLIEQGHTRIAMVTRSHEIADEQERRQGYQDALTEHQIGFDRNLIACGPADERGGFAATETLLQRNIPFSAIFAYNDAMAAGCLSALRKHHITVPGDISVVGFDDVLLARYLHPRLTTIRYPIEAMGIAAAELALHLAGENCKPTRQHLFKPELIVRESVSCRK